MGDIENFGHYVNQLGDKVYPADITEFISCHKILSKSQMSWGDLELLRTYIKYFRDVVRTQQKYIENQESRKIVERGIELLEDIVKPLSHKIN